MAALALKPGTKHRAPTSGGAASRSHAVLLLQVFAFAVMVFPSDLVVKAVGAGGNVAALLAYLMLFSYMVMLLFARHNPFTHRSPVRISLAFLWITALISYALMDRALLSAAQQSSADRWLIQLAGVSGVILLASEYLRSLEDVHAVLRAFTWGGAIAGLVSALQFWLKFNLAPDLLRVLPGFSADNAGSGFQDRSGLSRVPGTAVSPIEMGVVAGMLLPLAIYLAAYETKRSRVSRWAPLVLIGVSIPLTISRAGAIATVLAMLVFIPSMPPLRRLSVLAGIPVALGVISISAHRVLGTLIQYFTLGTNDDSISHRVNNVPYAVHLISLAPWFGQGGGTYIAPTNVNLGEAHILDDQYLDAGIELGLVGAVLLAFFLLWPMMAALHARKWAPGPQLRELSGALAGGALAGLVCSATFDSFGFPMFVMAEALIIGLIGAVWLLVAAAGGAAGDPNKKFRER